MKLYSKNGKRLTLQCSNISHELHITDNGEIESSDWKHLLKEFPNDLFKDPVLNFHLYPGIGKPSNIEVTNEEDLNSEVDNGIIS